MFRSIFFLLLWVWVASAQVAIRLEPGKPHEQMLAGGQTQSYRVTVAAGQYLRIVAEQRGIDVIVALFAPDGRKLHEVDGPNGDEGPESLSWIAEVPGEYRIEVRSDDPKARPGRYEARIEALRAATDADRLRVAAERAAAEAESLFEGDAAAKQRALEKYGEALARWRQLNDLPSISAALSARGDLFLKLGRRAEALESYQQALPVRRALRDKSGEATMLNNLAVLCFEQGDLRRAIEYHEQALPLRRETRDRAGEARTLNGLGVAYSQLGEKRKALRFFEQAASLRRELKDPAGEAISLNSLGAAYSDLGDQQRALDAFRRALPLRRDARGRAATLNNLGHAYDLLGAQEEALAQYEQALPLVRSINDKHVEAQTLNFIGLARMGLGDFSRAREAFAQSLQLRLETKNRDGEASTLNNLGLVHEALGKPRDAIAAYEQALSIFQGLGDRLGESSVRNNLGFTYEGLGQAQRALELHERALALCRAVGDRMREARIRYGIARIESRRNRLKQARAQIEEAIRIVESLRGGIASGELRDSYRATTQQYYDLYIDVLMRSSKRAPRSGLVAEALQASERGRARGLLELLAESGVEIREGVDAKLLERERELQEQIADKTAAQVRALRDAAAPAAGRAGLSLPASAAQPAADPTAARERELSAMREELRTVQADIRRTSPRYAALVQPPTLTVREMRQSLVDAETTLLEYSLGEERGYLWIVTPTSIRGIALPGRARIERAAKRFHDAIAAPSPPLPGESDAVRAARLARAARESDLAGRALARMILPAATSGQRLLIVADGALQYIPFAALPDPAGGLPLLRRHEIVMLPSASTLAALRREPAGRPSAPKSIAVLADPVFEPTDARVKTVAIKAGAPPAAAPELSRILLTKTAKESGAANGIPRLPATRREAEAILALAPAQSSRAVFDFSANRAFALQGELADYRIVHFATHGFLNAVHPERSGLVLSLVNEQGATQNGFLFAPDIYNLRLPAADLVVLSACQTGLGKDVRGEGIVGLTRGFMYAGAPRLVVSLWSVSDRATAELMKRFYEGLLGKGLRPAAALRAAQLEIAGQPAWRAPYYWAAFGLQGEWR